MLKNLVNLLHRESIQLQRRGMPAARAMITDFLPRSIGDSLARAVDRQY